jgi:outer membrane protein assembly factor BamB
MRVLIVSAALIGLATGVAQSEDWPQWRGPHGNGTSEETGLPLRWSPAELAWKASLGGVGISSPIVWGDRVFVTSQVGRGPLVSGSHPTLARGEGVKDERPLGSGSAGGEGQAEVAFLVEAFHREDGRRLWQHRLKAEGDLPPVHQKHNLTSPSPVTDGTHVYAWFGNGQLVALDLDGNVAWKRHLGEELGPFDIHWGHGSSPTLHGDSLILLCDHEPSSYLLALDKQTGQERWRVERESGAISYSTPTVISGPRGPEMIVNSTPRVDAYDPANGKLLWWLGSSHRFAIPVPAYHDGVLYMSRGYRSGPLMAVRAGGRGDVAETHVQWSLPTGAPYISSLLYYQGLVYMANGAGIVTALDPATGERVWRERIGGIFTASPVGGDGRIYLVSETGETVVLAAENPPRVLARNSVGERSVATPAISGGQILIRTDDHVIAIGPRP